MSVDECGRMLHSCTFNEPLTMGLGASPGAPWVSPPSSSASSSTPPSPVASSPHQVATSSAPHRSVSGHTLHPTSIRGLRSGKIYSWLGLGWVATFILVWIMDHPNHIFCGPRGKTRVCSGTNRHADSALLSPGPQAATSTTFARAASGTPPSVSGTRGPTPARAATPQHPTAPSATSRGGEGGGEDGGQVDGGRVV